MRRASILIAAVLASLAALAPAPATTSGVIQLVRVAVDSPERARLLAGFDVTEARPAGALDVVLLPGDARRLRALGFRWRVLIADLAEADRAAARIPAGPRLGVPGERSGYRHYYDPAPLVDLGAPDYVADLFALAAAHPGVARVVTLPERTLEGRSVYGIEIARNVNASDGRPVFYMDGIHHAREWPAGEMVIMFAHDLLQSDGTDARVAAILDTVRTILIPVVNPDGFTTSRESLLGDQRLEFPLAIAGVEGYWRKNSRGFADVIVPGVQRNPTAYGVDPNRNYAFKWGDDIGGSSGFFAGQTYRGTAPFSEPETRNVQSVVLSNSVTAMISNHTSGRLILRPWGHTAQSTPDESILKPLGDAMSVAIDVQPGCPRYVSQKGIGLYATTGTTDDWAYAATGSLGLTFEHGTVFHGAYAQTIPPMYACTRVAYLMAAEAAGDVTKHGVVTGRVRDAAGGSVPASLRVTKTFLTPTWSGVFGESIEIRSATSAAGDFDLHLNPSRRPVATQSESYTLTVEAAGYTAATRTLTVARGQTLDLGDIVLTQA